MVAVVKLGGDEIAKIKIETFCNCPVLVKFSDNFLEYFSQQTHICKNDPGLRVPTRPV